MPTPMNLEGYRRSVPVSPVPLKNIETQPRPNLFSRWATATTTKLALLGLASLLVAGALLRFMGWFGIAPALMTLLVSFVAVVVVYLLREAIAYVIFCCVGSTLIGMLICAVLVSLVWSIAAAISFMSGQVLPLEFGTDEVGAVLFGGYVGLCIGAGFCGLTIQDNCFSSIR